MSRRGLRVLRGNHPNNPSRQFPDRALVDDADDQIVRIRCPMPARRAPSSSGVALWPRANISPVESAQSTALLERRPSSLPAAGRLMTMILEIDIALRPRTHGNPRPSAGAVAIRIATATPQDAAGPNKPSFAPPSCLRLGARIHRDAHRISSEVPPTRLVAHPVVTTSAGVVLRTIERSAERAARPETAQHDLRTTRRAQITRRRS